MKMPPGLCRLLAWTATLWLLTDHVSTNRDCDVTFSSTTMKMGTFYSPNSPQMYPNNQRCVYKFVGLSSERVKIRFHKFNLQGMSPECKFDYMDIYMQLTSVSEPLLEAPMLGRFCGDDMQKDLPQLIISMNNIIILNFFSDADKGDEGFEGTFEFFDANIYNIGTPVAPGECNFRLESKERTRGFLLSPTYPGTYPDNLECSYEFRGMPGERIKLTFNDFSLFHGSDYCPFDYLLIMDGRAGRNAERIGVFCGKYENVTVFSSRENLYIKFVTRSGRVSFDEYSLDNNADYKFDRRGFNISYEFSTNVIRFDLRGTPEATHVPGSECDVRIRSTGGSSGTFQSPGYPSNFPKDTICRFSLDGEMNAGRLEKVKVKFKDFAISGVLESCLEGHLGVTFEGHRQPNKIDERFCGELWPPELISKDPRLILHFNTTGASKARFLAEYQFLSAQHPNNNDFANTDFAIAGLPIPGQKCSFLFSSEHLPNGVFNSPRHPDNYPPNFECVYIFQLAPGEKLLISFDMFSLSPQNASSNSHSDPHPPKCLNTTDYLQLNERSEHALLDNKYVYVSRFCGSKFPAPLLFDREVEFRFRSMRDSSNRGFKARFEFISRNDIQRSCVHTIHSDGKGGVLKSPRFPLKYESRTYCEWKIIASKPQNKILIQLETFKTEGDVNKDGCKDAVLRVQKGDEMREICGTIEADDLPREAVVSSDDIETIQFLTSSSALGFKGFQLTWTEIHISSGPCYGFKCKQTGYCISAELKCDHLPNCGPGDSSDEICPNKASSQGQKADSVQVVHIVIGTSISVFLAVLLLVCGVYHRKRFRPRDRQSSEAEQVEVRYVAATSGSNTTDRLLTLDKSDASRSSAQTPEKTEIDADHGVKVTVNNTPASENSSGHIGSQDYSNHQNAAPAVAILPTAKENHHHDVPDASQPSTSTHMYHTHPRVVVTPKVQKISIV
ncbi:cubilin-like isoform X1 [Mya arenaria]|uniref:cubilin-like isoform X1 n=2 Tax=Mya arenaria TaxID=6604 RepID=UPI0022E3E93F|nr:cubilin-like isoform X1 [Mya arenaria]